MGVQFRHLSVRMIHIAVLCAVNYDLIEKGELRPVPDLLKIGYAAIGKTHEYTLDFVKGMGEKAASIATAPHTFIWEKAKGFWHCLVGAKKVIEYAEWFFDASYWVQVKSMRTGVATVKRVSTLITTKMSKMSADDWDNCAKATAKGAGGLVTDFAAVHYSCAGLATVFSKIGALFGLEEVAEAAEIVEEAAEVAQEAVEVAQEAAGAAQSATKEILDLVFDEALGVWVLQKQCIAPAIVRATEVVAETAEVATTTVATVAQTTEKFMAPAVRGLQFVGKLNEAVAGVSPTVAVGSAPSNLPKITTAVSTAVEAGNAAEVATRFFDITQYDPSIGDLQKISDNWGLIEKLSNYQEVYQRVEKCGRIGNDRGTLGTARGAMYELEKAVDLVSKGEEVVKLSDKVKKMSNDLLRVIKTVDIDIVTKNKFIECKNIDWKVLTGDRIGQRIADFKELKDIALQYGKEFELHSKRVIPECVQTLLKEKGIKFVEG